MLMSCLGSGYMDEWVSEEGAGLVLCGGLCGIVSLSICLELMEGYTVSVLIEPNSRLCLKCPKAVLPRQQPHPCHPHLQTLSQGCRSSKSD